MQTLFCKLLQKFIKVIVTLIYFKKRMYTKFLHLISRKIVHLEGYINFKIRPYQGFSNYGTISTPT